MAKIKVRAKKRSTPEKESQPLMEKAPETKPSYNVKPIDNGWIVRKEWTDKEGRWQSKEKFMEHNPLEDDVMN